MESMIWKAWCALGLTVLLAGCSAAKSSSLPDGGTSSDCASPMLACAGAGANEWASCQSGVCNRGGTVEVLQAFDARLWANGMALSGDGRLVAIVSETELGGSSGTFVVLDRTTHAVLHTARRHAVSVAFSPDSRLIALGTSPGVVLSSSDFTIVRTIDGSDGPSAFSPDGSTLAIAMGGTVHLLSTTDWSDVGQVVHSVELHERLWSVAFSPDGSLLATGSGQIGFGSPHGEARLWKRSDLSLLHELDCHTADLAFSPDSHSLATACWNEVVTWDVTSGARLKEIPTGSTFAVGVAFSPDGSQLAVGTFGAGAWLFDQSTTDRHWVLADPAARRPLPAIKALQYDGSTLWGAAWSDTRAFAWNVADAH